MSNPNISILNKQKMNKLSNCNFKYELFNLSCFTITNDDFKAIEKALALLPSGSEFEGLSADTQEIIIKADSVMLDLLNKKKANNSRTARYIAEKRKVDKNYARSKGV